MIIAALILSIIALIISIACLCWLIGKQLSSHQITYLPADNFAPLAKPMGNDFAEIGDPMPEEKINFERI